MEIGTWINFARGLTVLGAACALVGALLVWKYTNKQKSVNEGVIESLQDSLNVKSQEIQSLKEKVKIPEITILSEDLTNTQTTDYKIQGRTINIGEGPYFKKNKIGYKSSFKIGVKYDTRVSPLKIIFNDESVRYAGTSYRINNGTVHSMPRPANPKFELTLRHLENKEYIIEVISIKPLQSIKDKLTFEWNEKIIKYKY